MKTRVITACIGLPLLTAVLFLLPWTWPTAVLFGAACVIAVWELCHETKLCNSKWMMGCAMLAALCVAFFSWTTGDKSFICTWKASVPALAVYAGLFVFFVLLFAGLLHSHARLAFSALCVAVFAGLVIPWILTALVRLRVMSYGRIYVGAALILAMTADTGAYFAGRAFGKHKLAPVVSPKKTVEGAIGGVLTTVLFMELYCLIFDKGFGYDMNYLAAALYGVLGSVLSIVGDLTFSVVKRQVGIKDYGKLLPGHGGILDRFDSMIVVAPLTELLVLLLPLVG